jgi:hypothetical protein
VKLAHVSLLAAALLGFAALSATPASAQRVFVAAQGSDANPCTFAAPCRTFQHAHDTVAAGGEIDVLDPAGYGAVTISKAISIQGHGYAGISVANGLVGILVNGSGTEVVSLDGLIVEGNGVGATGILVGGARSLTIVNCVVRNMGVNGLVLPTNGTALQTLSIARSSFTDNGFDGMYLGPTLSAGLTVVLDRVLITGNSVGVQVTGATGTAPLTVAVTDSVAANNGSAFTVSSAAGQSVTALTLSRTTVAGNGTGALAAGTGTLRLAGSAVTGNTTGYAAQAGGTIFSYGDNTIDANGGNIGGLTAAAAQ